jgi:hypothetical protein
VALRATFPGSRLVWRTVHPALPILYGSWGKERALNPFAVHALNEGVRSFAADWEIELLDTGRMLQQLIPRGMMRGASMHDAVAGTSDGHHLFPWVHIHLVNLMLNLAATAT